MTNDTAEPAVQPRYSLVAIVLHWILALSVAFEIALGFAMPDDASGFDRYQLHKSVGISILLLTLVRLVWRLVHRPPSPVEGGLGGLLAKVVHTSFYVILVLAPLTGWAIVSTSPLQVPTVLFGLALWPDLPLPAGANGLAEEAHAWLAWLGILLFVLHVAGALRHHFLVRDGLLRRMAPGGSTRTAMALTMLVVVVAAATLALGGSPTAGSAERDRRPEAKANPRMAEHAGAEADAGVQAEDGQPEAVNSAEAAASEPRSAPSWTIQPGGRLGFSLGGSAGTVRGSFSDWTGAIRFDPDRPETASIRVRVRLASASLGDATQDAMLQEPEFFDSSANPIATWQSTSVRRSGPGRYVANGMLSLRGISRSQQINFELSGEGERRHVQGTATIDRTAFSIGTGEAAAELERSVSLSFAFDAIAQREN